MFGELNFECITIISIISQERNAFENPPLFCLLRIVFDFVCIALLITLAGYKDKIQRGKSLADTVTRIAGVSTFFGRPDSCGGLTRRHEQHESVHAEAVLHLHGSHFRPPGRFLVEELLCPFIVDGQNGPVVAHITEGMPLLFPTYRFRHGDRVSPERRPLLPQRIARREVKTVEHSGQEGGRLERGGRSDEVDNRRELLPEREIRGRRQLRRPLHILQHRPAQVPHDDSREVDEGQELDRTEDQRDRTNAGGGQDPDHVERLEDPVVRFAGSKSVVQVQGLREHQQSDQGEFQPRRKVHNQRVREPMPVHLENAPRLRKILLRSPGPKRLLGRYQSAQRGRHLRGVRSQSGQHNQGNGGAGAGAEGKEQRRGQHRRPFGRAEDQGLRRLRTRQRGF